MSFLRFSALKLEVFRSDESCLQSKSRIENITGFIWDSGFHLPTPIHLIFKEIMEPEMIGTIVTEKFETVKFLFP